MNQNARQSYELYLKGEKEKFEKCSDESEAKDKKTR